jgi:hypothetical protein
MKTSIRTLILSLVFVCAGITGLKANDSKASPVSFQLNLKAYIKASIDFVNKEAMNADKLLEQMKTEKSSAKVCVCEIMELKSNNYQFDNVAVLSEKTNNGDMTADYKTASQLLSKEKKQMKTMFFDAIKVTQKFTAATDCVSLYLAIRSQSADLKLYDILNADIVRVK